MFSFIEIGSFGTAARFKIMEGQTGNDDKTRLKVDLKLIREKNPHIF